MATITTSLFEQITPNNSYSWSENYTFGIKITPYQPVTILGIYYYKYVGGSAGTVGVLYDFVSQTLLASKTFSGESASGWQYQAFDSSYSASANVPLVIAMYKPSGNTAGYQTSPLPPTTYNPLTKLTLLEASFGRYSAANVGSPSFPTNASGAWYGAVDMQFQFDDSELAAYSKLGRKTNGAHGGTSIKMTGVYYTRGVRKETVDGNPSPPCLALDAPGPHRFKWGVKAGTRTFTCDMKQVSNVVGYRPSFIIKADPTIGVNSDVVGTAGPGTGWVTVGPATVTPTSDGVLTVELWNNDLVTFNSTAYFDHIVKT